MDDEELHYLTYDPEEIWRQMMLTYIACGGDVLYGGDEKEILLRSVQAVAIQLLAGIDNALRMGTLRYAQREYLKLLGENRGCLYNEAIPAKGTAEITFDAASSEQVIAAGTVMTADGERYYKTLADIWHGGGPATESVRIECTEAGIWGNGLPSGTAMQWVKNNAAVAGIVTTTETEGGIAAEDLELYRERVRVSGSAAVTTGPKDQYEARAKAASAEVIDASAVMASEGVVDVVLLLRDGADETWTVKTVQTALDEKDARPLTDRVHVMLASTKRYEIYVGYAAGQRAQWDITAAMRQAMEEYHLWQDNAIGRALDPYRLVSLLYQAGATRVTLQPGSTFDGNALEYTETDAYTRVTGTIVLEAMA